jgi:hypothetical protein
VLGSWGKAGGGVRGAGKGSFGGELETEVMFDRKVETGREERFEGISRALLVVCGKGASGGGRREKDVLRGECKGDTSAGRELEILGKAPGMSGVLVGWLMI